MVSRSNVKDLQQMESDTADRQVTQQQQQITSFFAAANNVDKNDAVFV